jgi:tRNA dimethylallyltransferase
VAEAAAARFGASILSVDSMQVFRGMDIGTAKPSIETRRRIAHHMIDVVEPSDDFSAMAFQQRGREVLRNAEQGGERVIIAGGSGLHFRSIVDPMTFAPTDPEIREELEAKTLEELQGLLLALDPRAPTVVDVQNPRRVVRAIEMWRITALTPTERAASVEAEAVRTYLPLVEHASIGLDATKRSPERVSSRFDRMLQDGLVEEVRGLAPRLGRTASQALGYKEFLPVVSEGEGIAVASAETVRATNTLVKRQRTFFRRDPRIEWIPWQDDEQERIELAVNRVGEVAGWIS